MSAPPASKPFNPNHDYFISPCLLEELPKGITPEKLRSLHEKQEDFLKKGPGHCLSSQQSALADVLKRHEAFTACVEGTVSATAQLKKSLSRYTNIPKASGLVSEACKLGQDYEDFHAKFEESVQKIDSGSLESLLPKLQKLKALKKGDPFPELEITPKEISSVAEVCLLGKTMCNQMPKPVSASKDELENLGRGVNHMFSMLEQVEKNAKKPWLLSPGEVVELYGASMSQESLKAKNKYINALLDVGLSDEQIKKLTGFSDEQFTKITELPDKRPAPAGDEPSGAVPPTKKVKASDARPAPAAAPAAAAAAGSAPEEIPAAAAPAPAGSPAAAASAASPDTGKSGSARLRRRDADKLIEELSRLTKD